MASQRAVVLLSGGLDSATTLAIARSQGFECYALSVDYGQRHAAELGAAQRVATVLGAREHRVMHIDLAGIGGSALTDTSVPVPESPTEGIPLTYVPARNTIFLALALAWAEVLRAEAVFVGVNAIDYSISGDARVWIRNDGRARLMPVSEVCELPASLSLETLAVDRATLNLEWRKVTGRYRHEVGSKRCYRVRLERGQEIAISEDHSLFSLDSTGALCTVRGAEIAQGMPLVVPFDLSDHADSWKDDLGVLDLREYGSTAQSSDRRSSVVCVDGYLTNRLKRTSVPICLPVTDEFLRIVGLWLAEGGKSPDCASQTLSFSIGGLPGAPELLRRYFGTFGVSVKKSSANDFDYQVHSSVFCEIFRRLGLLGTAKTGTKRFPRWFWAISQRQRRIIVAGFWDGDGSQARNGEAPIYQKSHELIEELYHCLLLDGIFPSMKAAAHAQKRLALTRSVDFGRFVRLYPLWHRAKRDSLRAAAGVAGRDKTTGLWKCNALWQSVANSDLAAGARTRIYNRGGKYDKSFRAQRSTFRGVTALDLIRESKLAFLRVVSVEQVSYRYMYDLSVDGAENFLANGILAHNSGYPDCRPEFVSAFQRMAALATKAGVEGKSSRIHTPLMALSKAEIIREGVRLGVDYAATVSCYQADGEGRACGRCDSCRIRRAGFEAAGVADPTRYQPR